jgi:soluble lytic murein transglycosylase-like protein
LLLKEPAVDGGLIGLIASYNAGPGKFDDWKDEIASDDPLLFIESLPSLQTRTFLRRVLASSWIYGERLGQETPSLDALVAGDWPLYEPAEGAGLRVARYGTH